MRETNHFCDATRRPCVFAWLNGSWYACRPPYSKEKFYAIRPESGTRSDCAGARVAIGTRSHYYTRTPLPRLLLHVSSSTGFAVPGIRTRSHNAGESRMDTAQLLQQPLQHSAHGHGRDRRRTQSVQGCRRRRYRRGDHDRHRAQPGSAGANIARIGRSRHHGRRFLRGRRPSRGYGRAERGTIWRGRLPPTLWMVWTAAA